MPINVLLPRGLDSRLTLTSYCSADSGQRSWHHL